MSTEITSSENYYTVTRNNPGYVIVKCGATWCKPCNAIVHDYELLAEKYTNVKFYSLDYDKVKNYIDSEAVKVLPTFLLLNDGKPMGLIEGSQIDVLETYVKDMK